MSTSVCVRGAGRRAALAALATLALTASNVSAAEAAGASTTSFTRERALLDYNLFSGCKQTMIGVAVADDRIRAAGKSTEASSVMSVHASVYDYCRGTYEYFASAYGPLKDDAFSVQGSSRSAKMSLDVDMRNLGDDRPIPLELDLTWTATTPAERTRERTPVVGPNKQYRTVRARHHEVRQAQVQGRLVIDGIDYASATPASAQIDRERIWEFAKGDVPSDEDWYDEEE